MEMSQADAVKINTELKLRPVQHGSKDLTMKRKENRELETLALAEALGEWMTKLFHDEERIVRGAEGFFEDIEDGVVLCKMLKHLGISCETARDPPRTQFDIKENRQKFVKACKQAKLLSTPSFDQDPATGLLPVLLECAAIDQKQRARSQVPSIIPDAISKRTEGMAISQAMKDADAGLILAPSITQDDISTVVMNSRIEPNNANNLKTTLVESTKSVDAQPATATTKSVASRNRPVSKDVINASNQVASPSIDHSRRTRTVSEIPTQEKDQVVNIFIGFILFLFLLIYFMS